MNAQREKKTLVIFGANGFLGRYLASYFLERHYRVVGVARHAQGLAEGVEFARWDGRTLGDWAESLRGVEAVVNLAGRTVNCRYTEKNRAEILASREDSTRVIAEALSLIDGPTERPQVWMNSSTATIYRHAEDGPQDEENGEIGKGFSVGIAQAWERAFFERELPGVRRVAMRTAMVLANERGTVYDYLFKLAQVGLGGPVGGGNQRVSWIHVEDFCAAIAWLLSNEQATGIYNVVAPEAETNATVMREFRSLAGRRFGLPATRWMAEVGAFFLRTETELVLKSRWVFPQRLLKEGFVFTYPSLCVALKEMSDSSG